MNKDLGQTKLMACGAIRKQDESVIAMTRVGVGYCRQVNRKQIRATAEPHILQGRCHTDRDYFSTTHCHMSLQCDMAQSLGSHFDQGRERV